jgi:hypothetical protein
MIDEPHISVLTEKAIFSALRTHSRGAMEEMNLDSEKHLVLKSTTQYSSIFLINSSLLLTRLRFRDKASYIELPQKYTLDLPDEIAAGFTMPKSKKDVKRMESPRLIDAQFFVKAFPAIIKKAVLTRQTDFGCCGSYVKCSDARRCVKDDVMAMLDCAYNKNLLRGRIFYGKNKNYPPEPPETADTTA